MQHKRQLIAGLRYLCISPNHTCFKIKIIKKYYVVREIRPLIGRRIGIGRRLHVNQPLVFTTRRRAMLQRLVLSVDMF